MARSRHQALRGSPSHELGVVAGFRSPAPTTAVVASDGNAGETAYDDSRDIGMP